MKINFILLPHSKREVKFVLTPIKPRTVKFVLYSEIHCQDTLNAVDSIFGRIQDELQSRLDRLKTSRQNLEKFNEKFIYPAWLCLFESDSVAASAQASEKPVAIVQNFSNLTRWQLSTLLESLKPQLQLASQSNFTGVGFALTADNQASYGLYLQGREIDSEELQAKFSSLFPYEF